MNPKYSHETIQADRFDRYILVKGQNLDSVDGKLEDYGALAAPGNVYTYTFQKAQFGEWSIVKIPAELAMDYYGYHNLVYWFLGFPPDDTNYADKSIGVSIDRDEKSSYLLYNDYNLCGNMHLEDHLFGVFSNDEKFTLSIPFDTFEISTSDNILDFQKLLEKNDIDLETIISETLIYTEFEVVFNEK
jgi:hypothetical protein